MREGVYLTTTVLNAQGTSHINLHGGRLISPGVRILSRCELADKLIKRRMAITDASAIAKDGVETLRVTVIVHPDFLVALNRTGAHGETQQSYC